MDDVGLVTVLNAQEEHMSGFYLAQTTIKETERVADRLAFTQDTHRYIGIHDALAFAVTRVDSRALWAPASDPAAGVNVLLGGRVAFEEKDWSCAETLPFEGGLATRLLLSAWLEDSARIYDHINGAGVVIIFDSRDQTLHVITDRLGVFPVYESTAGGLMLCSHPDVLAGAMSKAGTYCEFDETTLAEFFATGTATQPYTYYKQIRQLEPATHYIWNLRPQPALFSRAVYWAPAYFREGPSHDPMAMAEELALAINNSVKRRTNPRLGRTLVLLSGGADSRCAVFAAQEPQSVCCLTLCDEPNEELSAAQELAAIAGAEHRTLQRDPEYYGRHAADAMRVSGGTWSLIDAHYLGAAAAIRAVHPGTILTGCYADYYLGNKDSHTGSNT